MQISVQIKIAVSVLRSGFYWTLIRPAARQCLLKLRPCRTI